MMKRLFLLAAILFVSGCICCGGANPTDLISGKKTTDDGGTPEGETSCSVPYIQSGSECCLDDNSNNVCDSEEASADAGNGGDEVTDTTQPETTDTTQPEVTESTETTLASGGQDNPTTTLAPTGSSVTTTQPTATSASYNCVKNAGFDPDKVYFGYSPNCGAKLKAEASTAAIRTGVDIASINIAVSSADPVMKLLECFYGPYSPDNPVFGECPKLFCPKTGSQQTLSGTISTSALSQMSGFAKKCK
jgi:hypothetical protein